MGWLKFVQAPRRKIFIPSTKKETEKEKTKSEKKEKKSYKSSVVNSLLEERDLKESTIK